MDAFLLDMDGVLVHEESIIPGADAFIRRLIKAGRKFLVLTNNSIYTPAGPVEPAAADRHRPARAVDLDVGAGHGPVPGHAAAAGQRLRDR